MQQDRFNSDEVIVVRYRDNATTLTAQSDIDDLEHALLLASAGDISLSPTNLSKLTLWVNCARSKHISILDGSTPVLLNVERAPYALLQELYKHVMHYGISHQHLPILIAQLTRRTNLHSLHRLPEAGCDVGSCGVRRQSDPYVKEFYRYLIARAGTSNLSFLTRFCASTVLEIKRPIPMMTDYSRSRRLEALSRSACDLSPDVVLAADLYNVCVIRKRDGLAALKWYHHVITQGELVMPPDHQAILSKWINK